MTDADPKPTHTPSLVARSAGALGRLFSIRLSFGRPRDYAASFALLLLIPTMVAATAQGAALVLDVRNRRLERTEVPRLKAYAAASDRAEASMRLQPLLGHPTLSGTAERLGRLLPTEARLRMLSMSANGRIEAQVDCPDPDALRAAMANDPASRSLRVVGETPAERDGVRVTLRSGS